MSKNFRIVMEFAWIAVFVMAMAAMAVSIFNGDNKNIIIFLIISLISASMYWFRRNQRKKS